MVMFGSDVLNIE